MTYTTKDINPTRKVCTVNFTAADIAGIENDILKKVASEAHVPGFRPGKAPVHLLRQRHAEFIAETLRERVSDKVFDYLRHEAKIAILDVKKIDGLDALAKSGDTAITVHLDVFPDFELPTYKGLKLGVPVETVTDEEVQKAVEKIRAEGARFEVVERAAGQGDYVKLSYTGSVDGKPVKEIAPDAHLYGTQSATWEEAGATSGPGIPEIVAGIVGLKAGDKAEFVHEFPADFKVEALRGKTAVYAVEIFEVRSKQLPDLDEAFFEAHKLKDLADLQERVRISLQRSKDEQTRNNKATKAAELLLAAVDFPVPESAIDKIAEDLYVTDAMRKLRDGVSLDEVQNGRAEYIKTVRPDAEHVAKRKLLFTKIAETEKVEVSRQDFATTLTNFAYSQSDIPPKQFVNDFLKESRRVAELHEQILIEKALAIVLENAE